MLTRDEALTAVCEIHAAVSRTIGDYSKSADGFCNECPAGRDQNWRFQNEGHAIRFMLDAVTEKIGREGFDPYVSWGDDVIEKIMDIEWRPVKSENSEKKKPEDMTMAEIIGDVELTFDEYSKRDVQNLLDLMQSFARDKDKIAADLTRQLAEAREETGRYSKEMDSRAEIIKQLQKEIDALREEKILAPKHTGMKISAVGVLGRIRDGQYNSTLDFGCGEMLGHLEVIAKRFYSGDLKVVDEFLQLYCLDEHRPTPSAGGSDEG